MYIVFFSRGCHRAGAVGEPGRCRIDSGYGRGACFRRERNDVEIFSPNDGQRWAGCMLVGSFSIQIYIVVERAPWKWSGY